MKVEKIIRAVTLGYAHLPVDLAAAWHVELIPYDSLEFQFYYIFISQNHGLLIFDRQGNILSEDQLPFKIIVEHVYSSRSGRTVGYMIHVTVPDGIREVNVEVVKTVNLSHCHFFRGKRQVVAKPPFIVWDHRNDELKPFLVSHYNLERLVNATAKVLIHWDDWYEIEEEKKYIRGEYYDIYPVESSVKMLAVHLRNNIYKPLNSHNKWEVLIVEDEKQEVVSNA